MWFYVFTFFANYAFFGVICLPQKLPLRIFFTNIKSDHLLHTITTNNTTIKVTTYLMFLSPWCLVVKRAGATAGEVWRREGASPPIMGETSDLVWFVTHKRSDSFQSEYIRLFEKPLRKLCWSSFIQYQQAMYSQPKRDHPSIHTVTHQEGQMWWSHGLLKMMSVQGSCQKAGQITGQTSLL